MDSAGNMRRTVRASPWRRVTPLPPSRSPPGLTATPPARTTRPAAATPPRSPARRRRGRGGGRQDRASGLRRLGFTMGRHPGRTCVKRKMSIHCRSFSLSRAGPRRINEAPQAQWYVIVIGLLREAAPWSRPPDASPGSLPEVSRYYLPVPRKHALRRHAFLSHGLSESAHTTGAHLPRRKARARQGGASGRVLPRHIRLALGIRRDPPPPATGRADDGRAVPPERNVQHLTALGAAVLHQGFSGSNRSRSAGRSSRGVPSSTAVTAHGRPSHTVTRYQVWAAIGTPHRNRPRRS